MMARILVALIAAGLVTAPCRGDDAGASPETQIRLEVDPAPAPRPGLAVPALARVEGDEAGKSHLQLLQVRHGAGELPLRQGGVRASRAAAGDAIEGAARAGPAGIRPIGADPGGPSRPARQARLADPRKAQDRRVQPAASRRAADARTGPGASGPLSVRGRDGTVRRRDPDRPDHVRHVSPPGRAPDAHRRSGRHRHRLHGHRPVRGDARPARLP